MNRLEYWLECIDGIAEACGLTMTVGQTDAMAKLIADAHGRFGRLQREALSDDAALSPPEALTYILETIRDRGWEMPERSRLTRRYGPDGESLYVCWGADSAEMDMGDGCDWRGNIRVKVLQGYLEFRRWQDVTKANIDAALGFIFRQ